MSEQTHTPGPIEQWVRQPWPYGIDYAEALEFARKQDEKFTELEGANQRLAALGEQSVNALRAVGEWVAEKKLDLPKPTLDALMTAIANVHIIREEGRRARGEQVPA